MPFPSLRASPQHTRDLLASGLVPAGRQSLRVLCGVQEVGVPAGLPQTDLGPSPGQVQPPNSSRGSCKSQAGGEARRPHSIPSGHPFPHPLLCPRAAKGHAHPHRDLPQPNPIPCKDTNPPGGTRTGDPKPRGSHCTPSWPRSPGLSLDVGVACHMWPCPGWQHGPGFPSPRPCPQRAAPRFGSCPAPRGAHHSLYLLGQGWAETQGETQLRPGKKGLRGRQT